MKFTIFALLLISCKKLKFFFNEFKNTTKNHIINYNLKNYNKGGFTKNSAKLLALSDYLESIIKDLEKNPEIKKKLDELRSEEVIVILNDEPLSPVNNENLDQINKSKINRRTIKRKGK